MTVFALVQNGLIVKSTRSLVVFDMDVLVNGECPICREELRVTPSGLGCPTFNYLEGDILEDMIKKYLMWLATEALRQ